jgi:hypothetical protein
MDADYKMVLLKQKEEFLLEAVEGDDAPDHANDLLAGK